MEHTFRLEDAEIVDMLISRCWQGIQVEISSSQLEIPLYMTDCCSWLQKWKLKSFSEKFKLSLITQQYIEKLTLIYFK